MAHGPVLRLNEQLDGSPYLLPDDENGGNRATLLAAESAKIDERYQTVGKSFALQSRDIRMRIETMMGERVLYMRATPSKGLAFL